MKTSLLIALAVLIISLTAGCYPEAKKIYVDSVDSGIQYVDINICSVDIRLVIENGKGKQAELKNNNDASVIVEIDNNSTGATVLQNCLWPDGVDSEPSTGYTNRHDLKIRIFKGEGEFIHWTCSKTISDLFDVYNLCDEADIYFYEKDDSNGETPDDNQNINDDENETEDQSSVTDEETANDDDTVIISRCGNDIVEYGEVCDGNSRSCSDYGFDNGEAECFQDCSGFDLSECYDDNPDGQNCTFSTDCPVEQVCSAEGKCVSPYDLPWTLTIESAEVSLKKNDGSDWDAFGGAPDLLVKVIKNGAEVFSTTEKQNTFEAQWDESFTISIAKEDTLKFEIYDIDIQMHDIAAVLFFGKEGNETIPPSVFREGRIIFQSTEGQLRSFIFRFTKNW